MSARNATELETLRDEIVHKSPKNHHVHLSVVDLGDVSHLSDTVTKLMSDSDSWAQADDLLFISNAGSLGNLAPIGSSSFRPENIASSIDLNVTSYCYLTSEFVRRVKDLSRVREGASRVKIVNISSLAALQAFESWSVYCAGKAARDMFYQALAKELKVQSLDQSIKVLNYAPGPLDTDMQREIRENPEVDPETQAVYRQMKEENKLVDPAASADKLIELLSIKDNWNSGCHIDFYDV